MNCQQICEVSHKKTEPKWKYSKKCWGATFF